MIYSVEKMLERLNTLKAEVSSTKLVALHLGCGPQILEGFVNADKYHKDDRVEPWSLEIENLPNSYADLIYSSHALEHLPYRRAQIALKNWGRVLKSGGRLYLDIPDLEETCRIMIDPNVSDFHKENWYLYTLFGYQVDPGKYAQNPELNLPEDPGQFHYCGFTPAMIKKFLGNCGFVITELFKYDGWSTPSMWIEATKA
jgi:SAM-dependent methyltransferase